MPSSPAVLTALTAVILLHGASASAQEPQPAPPRVQHPPNVVVLLADDLGYGDLGCYGHPAIRTPRLDRLAAEGVRFTDCYAAAPVCSPSRAALMTGRNPYRLGIRDWIPANSGIFLRAEENTVAELLRDGAGYRTGFAGKWHLNSRFDGVEPTPGDHGFDHWLATQNNAAPTHENPRNFVRNRRRVGPTEGNSSKLIVDEAVAFIDAGPKETPFFLCAWFHAPHEVVDAPDDFAARYGAEPDETKREYYGCVEYMDDQVGRLLDALDARGLRDNTLVVFTSDNGPEALRRYPNAVRSHGSAGPLRGMKLHLHEGGLRVPAIARWPAKIKPGGTCREPVGGVDLLPTLCEVAGVTPPKDRPLDGTSLVPLLTGGQFKRERPLYWRYEHAIGGEGRVALRDGPWKLMADEKLQRFALYNLADDPAEKADLAEKEPARTSALATALRKAHAEIDAQAASPK